MTTSKAKYEETQVAEDYSHSLYGPEEDGNVEALVARLPLPAAVWDGVAIDSGSEDYTAVYRNKGLGGRLIANIHPSLDTFNKLFNNSAKLFARRPCFGYRKYDYATGTSEKQFSSFTYAEVNQRRMDLGSGVLHVLRTNPYKDRGSASHAKIDNHLRDWRRYGKNTGTQEDNCSFIVSIFSPNRLEWVLSDLACSAYSLANTALYDTLGPDATKFILDSTRSPIIICSKDKVKLLLDLKRGFPDMLGDLICIVSMDPLFRESEHASMGKADQALVAYAQEVNVSLFDIDQVEKFGRMFPTKELPPTANTLYTVSFTSGTTGSKPKGVMVNQGNAATSVTFVASGLPQTNNGRAFIFLPLTHIYERKTTGFALTTGYYLGFPQLTVNSPQPVNSFENLIEDWRIFKPTYVSTVPRILNKIESVVKAAVAECDGETTKQLQKIFAYKIKKQAEKDEAEGYHEEYDEYPAYKNLRSIVGFDNLLWTQTASAPISPATIVYLKAALNIGVRQMYGLTETYGASTQGGGYECKPGSCGSVGIGCEVKLQDLPAMGYRARDNMGEVLYRGPQVFKGYYRNKEATDSSFDKDGWFHSGDVAMIDRNNGRLFIIDRVKNFFKLSQGEYVSPEKVENTYLSCNPILAQLYVHGDSLKSFLVGIVGVDYGPGLRFLRDSCGYNSADLPPDQLVAHLNKRKNKITLLKTINTAVGPRLQGFEKLHNIDIDINPLTVQKNVVTPTFKIKRAIAAKYFADVFHKLYDQEHSLILVKSKL